MCNAIEINLREMNDETDLPAAARPDSRYQLS